MGARIRYNLEALAEAKTAEDKVRITQVRIAEETGVSQKTINRLWNDPVDRADGPVLSALLKYFKCTLDELLTIEEAG